MSQIDTEEDKILRNFSIFKDFMCFSPNFRETLWIGTLKRVNKERMCCLLAFLEEITAVFQVTLLQIDIENDKEPRIFQFSKVLCIFVKVSQTSCIGVFQRVNNEKIGSSSRLKEEIIAMF